MKQVTLLGPLDGVDLAAEVGAFGVDGPVALVTAGWEEGERNDAEVDRRLGGGSRNLNLYGRRLDVLESDAAYADAQRLLRTQLDEMREVYLLRLTHALAGVDVIRRRFAEARRGPGPELDTAIDAVRAIDQSHASAIEAANQRFYAQHPPHERPSIARHREEVAGIVAGCTAIAIAGGHVGVLNDCLHLFNLAVLIDERPLLAWSSGAMAVSERIVVSDDDDPAGRPDELYDIGIGVAHGMVALPAAAARLRTHDPVRMAVLAQRCAPSACVLLDAGDRLPLRAGRPADLGSVGMITADGRVLRGAAAA
ncbi:MAG: hypothetical protein ACYDCS_02640 [Candidatus Dormibacteria bacterium]